MLPSVWLPFTNALDHLIYHVSPNEKLCVNSVPVRQKLLSSKVNVYCFQGLFDQSSPPHPAVHLDPIEFRVAVKWWLGLDTSQGSQCAFCPAHSLDPIGHHALTCKCGGDVISCHNAIGTLLCTSSTLRMLLYTLKLALASFKTICSHDLLIELEPWKAPCTSPLCYH